MKSGNSVVGTPYTSIRHLDNQTIAVESTPERAVEHSLNAKVEVPRQSVTLDPKTAKAFTPEKVANAEGRIGVKGGSG